MSFISKSGPRQSYAQSIRKHIKENEDPGKAEFITKLLGEEVSRGASIERKQATRRLANRCQLDVGGPLDRIEKILRWLRREIKDPEALAEFLGIICTRKNGETLVENFRGKNDRVLDAKEAQLARRL
jgi:hypothetical protein